MKSLGEEPQSLSAILITHEHSDHVYGLATLAKKLRIPVFMTEKTHRAWARSLPNVNGERPQIEKLEQFRVGHSLPGRATSKSIPSPFLMTRSIRSVLPFACEGMKVSFATDLGRLSRRMCATNCAARTF